MKPGSIVECQTNFDDVRACWGFLYPFKGDILTVFDVSEHPNAECRAMGIVLLTFEEKPDLVPVCDRDIFGNVHFIELVFPDSICAEILEFSDGELVEGKIYQQ